MLLVPLRSCPEHEEYITQKQKVIGITLQFQRKVPRPQRTRSSCILTARNRQVDNAILPQAPIPFGFPAILLHPSTCSREILTSFASGKLKGRFQTLPRTVLRK